VKHWHVPGTGHRWRACLWLAAAWLHTLAMAPAQAQDSTPVPAAVVEAAYLRNFARYVGWPPPAFAAEQAAWRVCVLGQNHFDGALEATFRDRKEQGRPFEVVRAARLEQLPACQIVFVDLPLARDRQAALNVLRKRPVLTVGNAAEFLDEGGIIRLASGERVEMSINLDQARAVALSIPSKMLEVAREVVENGTLRRRR
jgi:hypothetical protein